MRAPPNRIVLSKIRNLPPNVNREMQQISVTKGIDSTVTQVLRRGRHSPRGMHAPRRFGCSAHACLPPAVGYTANQIHREHFFLPRLIIRSSDIHAAGCFTLENIPKNARVLEYTGERITKAEGDVRYEGRPFTYLFGVGDGEVVIDGHGMAMFVNHSCDPNCETDEENDRVYIAAIRDIAAGEELTYDYYLYDGDDEAPLLLRQQELPRQHVLSRGTEEKGTCRGPQEETGRTGGEEERRRSKSESREAGKVTYLAGSAFSCV